MTGNEEFTGPIINRDFVTGRPSSSSSSRILRRGMHYYGDKSSIFFFPKNSSFWKNRRFFFSLINWATNFSEFLNSLSTEDDFSKFIVTDIHL